MKFGTFLYQTSPKSIAAIARKAEESGFESIWIPERADLNSKPLHRLRSRNYPRNWREILAVIRGAALER